MVDFLFFNRQAIPADRQSTLLDLKLALLRLT
jgi:hypothetical protein